MVEHRSTSLSKPQGRRNKYRYEPALGVFRLGKVLPAGAAFPYDFGFIPGTRADDGDPLDVSLLMDESAYPGCLVVARPIGVLEAEQTENGETIGETIASWLLPRSRTTIITFGRCET